MGAGAGGMDDGKEVFQLDVTHAAFFPITPFVPSSNVPKGVLVLMLRFSHRIVFHDSCMLLIFI